MGSGKYSALSGAIAREQAISNVAANLANINTSGYRRSQVSFASILRGEQQAVQSRGINFTRINRNFSDFTGGPLRKTDDPLNFAIHGDGFFKIQGTGGPLLTRRGDFMINAQGVLTTSNNQPVLDEGNNQIILPDTDTGKVAADENGTLYVLGPQGARTEVGRLAVVTVADKEKLQREADTSFSLKEGAGELPSTDYRVIQGSVELANVNMSSELTQMINNYRTFETYHKVLKSYSTLGEVQDDLGTLG
jgi:flagellar basal-body rod protein FlgF